jgi:hypothetical protein
MAQAQPFRQNISLLFINFLIVLTINVISISNVLSQTHWKKISDPTSPSKPGYYCSGFFLNRDYGIIATQTDGSTNSISADFIFRTTNAGNSWTSLKSYPTYPQRTAGLITSVCMRDSLNGWFNYRQELFIPGTYTHDIEHNGIYGTTDGGLTWTDYQDSAMWYAVYEASRGNLIVSNGGIAFEDAERGMVISTAYPLNKNGFSGGYYRTLDGGQSWDSINMMPNIASAFGCFWGIYCQKNTKTYYIYPGGPSNLGAISNDFGNTWRAFSVNDTGGGGDVEGAGNAVYIPGINGLNRTTDGAQNWVTVGGPSSGSMHGALRFMVPSKCNGAVVVAYGFPADSSITDYGVWMTTDGGDGTIPLPDDTLTIARAAFDTISSCDTALASILFANCGCTPADYHFDSVRVVGDGRFSVAGATAFPTQWNGFASRDSLHLRFTPNHQSGAAQGTLHLYGRIIRDSVETPFDSIIPLRAFASSVGPSLKLSVTSNALNFGKVDICNGSDTTIRITNSGCGGPLTITAEELAANGFEVTQLSLPITLAKDSSIVLHVHALPTDAAPLSGTLLIRAMADSITRDITVDLRASGVWGGSLPMAIPDSLNFNLVSLCNTDSLSVAIYNAGCDSVTMDTAWVAGDSDFSIATLPPRIIAANDTTHYVLHFHPLANGSRSALLTVLGHDRHGSETRRTVSIPVSGVGTSSILVATPQSVNNTTGFCSLDTLTATISNSGCDSLRVSSTLAGEGYSLVSGDSLLAPNANGTYRIVFTPNTQKGANIGSLLLHFTSLATDSTKDTTIVLMANVGDGAKAFTASPDTAHLGVVYICQSRDTVITLYNTGCDTLHIISGSFNGTNGTYASDATYPIIIPPGDSAKEEILFNPDTTGHPLSISGNFTVTSDANSGPKTVIIPLTTSIIYPVHLTLSLLKTDSATDGSIVTFYLLLGGGEDVRSTSLRALHFDLTHNDDLLSLVSATGAGLNHFRLPGTAGSTRDSFTVAPISSSDTIGTLTFQVYLTKDSTTTLTLSNITFDTPASLSPDCIASLGDSGSVFSYIYSCSDRTLQHFMQTGSPFTIESIVPNPARDEIQISILRKSSEPIAFELYDVLGKRVVKKASLEARSTLDVSTIPEGTYYLRASASGEVQTRRIVIER